MADLTWQARDALRVFEKLEQRPGEGLSPKTIWVHLGGKSAATGEGVRELAEKGYVTIENGETNIVLTEAGYEAIRIGATL